MESLLLAMAGFVLVGSITPGPVNVIATNTGLNAGIYKAFTYVLGASLSFSVVVFIAGLMLNEVSELLPKATLAMQIFGSAFLLYVAFQLSRASASFTDANENQSAGFWAGSFTQAINLKHGCFRVLA
ncbi:LysE family translocator [Vibrio mexicanus]|uniref:LysE family translocator n=1 Tax=Vibrio mexicanus TaxID=1004326 RepID=UPI00069B39EC|nr:LysE family transporter [Vibrio mexicanus]